MKFSFIAAFVASVFFATLSCGIEPVENPVQDKSNAEIAQKPQRDEDSFEPAQSIQETDDARLQPIRSYLQATVAPCTKIEGSPTDPCTRRDIWKTNPFIFASVDYPLTPVPHKDGFKTLHTTNTPHLIVRALALPGTTRCTPQGINFLYGEGFTTHTHLGRFHCFTDFNVRSYMVGRGPGRLTVETTRSPNHDSIDWSNDDDKKSIETQVARLWEGLELVLYLAPAVSGTTEAWNAIWVDDVQRLADGTIAVVSHAAHYYRGRGLSPSEMLRIEAPLEHFERDIEQAFLVLDGKVGGTDPNRLSLVQDANTDVLHQFYVDLGEFNDPVLTPAPPPPIPGENDPYTPGTNVDDPPTPTPTPTVTPTPTPTPALNTP